MDIRRMMLQSGGITPIIRRVDWIVKEGTTNQWFDTGIIPSANTWAMVEWIPISYANEENPHILFAGVRNSAWSNCFVFGAQEKRIHFTYGTRQPPTYSYDVIGKNVRILQVGSRYRRYYSDSLGNTVNTSQNFSAATFRFPIWIGVYNQQGTPASGGIEGVGRFGVYNSSNSSDVRTDFAQCDVWFSPVQVLNSGVRDVTGRLIKKGEYCLLNETTGALHKSYIREGSKGQWVEYIRPTE